MAHVLFKKGDIEGSSKAVAMALQEVPPLLSSWARIKSVSAINQSYSARQASAVPLPAPRGLLISDEER